MSRLTLAEEDVGAAAAGSLVDVANVPDESGLPRGRGLAQERMEVMVKYVMERAKGGDDYLLRLQTHRAERAGKEQRERAGVE